MTSTSSDDAQRARLATALADRYRIERELGEGGMATVYLAHDHKHHRAVAIKVLKPELGAVLGAERFLSEIQVTAGLQHPHLLPLFDSGEASGLLYYVMPFIEGETLRARLERDRQLSVEETVRVVTILAGALDFAHARGVVHRDMKPENILLQAGQPVIADFGIALAVSNAGGARVTQTGLSLGTPHYMSPEQAMGDRAVDARSDQYALAALTYEMLTGEPPHTGATAQVIIARLMSESPRSVRSARPAVSAAVDAAVLRALAKVPADRFATCGDFALALGASTSGNAIAHETADDASPKAGAGSRRKSMAAIAGIMALVVAVAGGIWWWRAERAPDLVIGRSDQLTTNAGLKLHPALSPDGKLVAFAAGSPLRMRIFIRPIGGGRSIPLSDDSLSIEVTPRWSPDGTNLLYLNRLGVSISPALGGASRTVIPHSALGFISSATWSPDGREIAFTIGDSLKVTSLNGGASRLVAVAKELHSCAWSPNGASIACTSGNSLGEMPGTTFGNVAPSAIVVAPAAGGAFVPVTDAKSSNRSPVWSPHANALYFLSNRDGPRDLYLVQLSSSGQPRGVVARVTTGLGAVSFSIDAAGTRITYARYAVRANIWTLPLYAGEVLGAAAATQLTSGTQSVESMRVSRDGAWVIYDSDLRGNSDIYRIPVGGGEPQQLTSEPFDEFAGDLSPDGTSVVYHAFHDGHRDVENKPLDGGAVERIANTPTQESFPLWSADGRAVLYLDQLEAFQLRIARRNASGTWLTPHRVVASQVVGWDWSPDAASIVYITSDRRGMQLRIASLASGTSRLVRAFERGDIMPNNVQWSRDGRTLFLKSHYPSGLATFWSMPVAGGSPRLVARFPDPDRQSSRGYFAVDTSRLYFTIEDYQSDVFVAGLVRR